MIVACTDTPSSYTDSSLNVALGMSTTSFFDDGAATVRPKTADGGPQRPAMMKRPAPVSRNVSFSPSVQSSSGARRPEHHRFNSEPNALEPQQPRRKVEAHIQRVDRHAQNVDP